MLALVCALLLAASSASVWARSRTAQVLTGAAPAGLADDPLPQHRESSQPPSAAPAVVPSPRPPRPLSKSARAAQLRTQLTQTLAASGAKIVGASVEIEGMGRVVDHNGSMPLIPASTQKLYTGATALKKLGPDYRYTTEVRRLGEIGLDGTLNGNLILVGSGDPFLTKADLDSLANATMQAGIKKVQGELFGDDTKYDRVRTGPGWRPHYVPRESGPLSALAVDENKWNRDPAFLADPVVPNVELFRGSLNAVGVIVTGPTAIGSPLGTKVVASHASSPFIDIATRMLKESHNFAAEMILKEIGASAGHPTTAGGIDGIGALGEEMGIRRGQAVDGSGLSRDNLSAPHHQVDWLVKLNGSPTGRLLQNSLQVTCTPPGAGPSWLTHRLCGTPAAGKVYGKTGFLSGVRSLAGYATTANGKRIWFSFNLIDSAGTNQAWASIDQALVLLTSFST